MRLFRRGPSPAYASLQIADPLHKEEHVDVHVIHCDPKSKAQTLCYVYEPIGHTSRALRYLGKVAIIVGLQPKPNPMLGFRKNQPTPQIYVSSVVTVSPTGDSPLKGLICDDKEPLNGTPMIWRFYGDAYEEWVVEGESFNAVKT